MQEQARNKYKELSNKEKDIKREYGKNIYRNTSEEDKQKLREYLENYCKINKIYYKKKLLFLLFLGLIV